MQKSNYIYIIEALSKDLPYVGVRSHSWIAAGVSLRPISLCHDLFIKGVIKWK
jgi:hypothetical protein